MLKMASRGEDGFVYMVSSDGCREAYPENRASNFKILLKEPIEINDYEDWEVALLDVHYPRSWSNVGSKTELVYELENETRRVKFPDWQFKSVKELVSYIRKEIGSAAYVVGEDELGGFYVESEGAYCEMGFSQDLAGLLGLAEVMSVEDSIRRTFAKNFLEKFMKEGSKVDDKLMSRVEPVLDEPLRVAEILRGIVDVERMYTEGAVKKAKIEVSEELRGVMDILKHEGGSAEIFSRNMRHVLRYMRHLKKFPPKRISAVNRGRINTVPRLFVYSNFIEPMDVNDHSGCLLRVLNVVDGPDVNVHEIFSHLLYHPVKKVGKISMMNVYILGENGELVPFKDGRVLMTFQFRRKGIRR